MRKTREFKLSICVVIWVFIFVFILHLAKEYKKLTKSFGKIDLYVCETE